MAIVVEVENKAGFAGSGVKRYRGPALCVQAGGIAGDNMSHYRIVDDGKPESCDVSRPSYRVPSMAEVEAVEPCGLVAASLFAGCGGSCLGYRMAGFRVAWANECDPDAVKSYLPNHPGTFLDRRDVREVSGSDVLAHLGGAELDLLDGSPPCVSFSTAGKREQSWNKLRKHAGITQRTDDLFAEYVRLLGELRPRAFVAENVAGMVRGVSKGHFIEALRAMRALGYRVAAKVLDAQWLGVPQHRERLFFVGMREDLGLEPAFPRPLPHRYSLAEACPWLGGASLDGANGFDGPEFKQVEQMPTVQKGRPVNVRQIINNVAYDPVFGSIDQPCTTVMKSGPSGSHGEVEIEGERRKFTIAELKRVCSFPDDFELVGTYAQQWARLGNSVPPLMARAIGAAVRDRLLGVS